jgi:hypothetical protein
MLYLGRKGSVPSCRHGTFRSAGASLVLTRGKHYFSVLSVNIQSLPAKFNKFAELIKAMQNDNTHPNVICLQELWKLANPDMYVLDGYHPLVFKSRANNVQGGGVGLYISCDLNFSANIIRFRGVLSGLDWSPVLNDFQSTRKNSMF